MRLSLSRPLTEPMPLLRGLRKQPRTKIGAAAQIALTRKAAGCARDATRTRGADAAPELTPDRYAGQSKDRVSTRYARLIGDALSAQIRSARSAAAPTTDAASTQADSAPRADPAAASADPDVSRVRAAGGPEDAASYTCSCGFYFTARVSTTVRCPHCHATQVW